MTGSPPARPCYERRMLPSRVAASLLVLGSVSGACGGDDDGDAPDATPAIDAAAAPDAAGAALEVVGRLDLGAPADNLGLTLAGDFAYVGSLAPSGAVQIVGISNPEAPQDLGALPTQQIPLELRAVPDLDRLYVLQVGSEPAVADALVAYDISTPTAPELLGSYPMAGSAVGHEFFLWRDPADAGRLVAVISASSGNRDLQLVDVSDPAAMVELHSEKLPGDHLHSMSLSPDGTRLYLAQYESGFAVMDTSDFAAGLTDPVLRWLTPEAAAVDDCGGRTCKTHSAVLVPGRDLVLLTEEDPRCPWGGVRIADVSDEAAPAIVGEVALDAPGCGQVTPELGYFGYSAHNPTLTEHLALVTWFSGGLQVIDTTDPTAPAILASFIPTDTTPPAAPEVYGEVGFVSYPIVRDGLIYVADGRNGLFVLRYTGPYADEITGADFLDGSSNL